MMTMKLIVRFVGLAIILLIAASPSFGQMQSAQSWCEQGNRTVSISGLVSTTKVQQSFPSCTVTVYLHGVTPATKATLYLDSNTTPTPLANPFTANSTGLWRFYATDGNYDVVLSGAGFPSPLTLYDIRLNTVAYLTSFGAKCDGSTDDTVAFTSANTFLAVRGGDLIIPVMPTGTFCVVGTVSTSVNVNLQFQTGGALSVTSSNTATIYGSVVSAPQRIFAGSGKIAFGNPPGKVPTAYTEWWGAKADGSTDATTAIQSAITSICGNGTNAVTGSTLGNHSALVWLTGKYVTSATLVVPPSCYADLSGTSMKGTYILQTSGTGPAMQIQGAFYQTSGGTRTASEFDANVKLHDISIGSTVGHGLQLLNAYRTRLSYISLISAGVTSNYLDMDGSSVIAADNIYIQGNDTFPGNYLPIPYGFTQGVTGVYITSRPNAFGKGAAYYNLSGEFFLNNIYCEGQQTGDCIFVDNPTATDFSIYPVFVNGADVAITSGNAAYRQNGKVIGYFNNCYCERASGGTVDLIRIESSQGEGTVYGTNNIGPTARLNFAGDGVNRPSMIVTGSTFSTFVSSSSVYGTLNLQSNIFVADTASAFSTWSSSGSAVTILNGNLVGNGTGAVTTSILNVVLPFPGSSAGTVVWQPGPISNNSTWLQAPSGAATSASHRFFGTSTTSSSGNTEYIEIGSNLASAGFHGIRSNQTNAGVVRPMDMIMGTTTIASFGTSGSTGGFSVGNPTGGTKVFGTINLSVDIYKNNTAYTNPDYAFERYFTGSIKKFAANPGASTYKGLMPLPKLLQYVRKNYHLPGAHEQSGMFERADYLLEKLEEAYLYIFKLNERIDKLEKAMTTANAIYKIGAKP